MNITSAVVLSKGRLPGALCLITSKPHPATSHRLHTPTPPRALVTDNNHGERTNESRNGDEILLSGLLVNIALFVQSKEDQLVSIYTHTQDGYMYTHTASRHSLDNDLPFNGNRNPVITLICYKVLWMFSKKISLLPVRASLQINAYY